MRRQDNLWWIEHDLPPSDRYQCAAYQVRLIRDHDQPPYLTVHRGTTIYRVRPVAWATLTTALSRAGPDPPLILIRRMGPALDP